MVEVKQGWVWFKTTEASSTSTLSVRNPSDRRLAIKIRCSDNNIYRLNPVYAIVEPGQELDLEITRSGSIPPKQDKLLIQCMEVGMDAKDAQEVFHAPSPDWILKEIPVPLYSTNPPPS